MFCISKIRTGLRVDWRRTEGKDYYREENDLNADLYFLIHLVLHADSKYTSLDATSYVVSLYSCSIRAVNDHGC